jgi:hypothetical protein
MHVNFCFMAYDFIGDIHGYANELEQLLLTLGYTNTKGYYEHPSRKAFFVGDYIDRGPQIRETLQLVKGMTDAGQAIALMGNHEFNAILYHIPNGQGDYLRLHNTRNVQQHSATLEQFRGYEAEWQNYLQWFMSLPVFAEGHGFRAVHACWDISNILYLQEMLGRNLLSRELILKYWEKDDRFTDALEQTLKGKELQMPHGLHFYDKDGHRRDALRIRWWDRPHGSSYHAYSVELMDQLPHDLIEEKLLADSTWYEPAEKPVFFGHYWLKGRISLFRQNVCCLDYSVAKRGHLVAYRWDGEQQLDAGKLVSVESRSE